MILDYYLIEICSILRLSMSETKKKEKKGIFLDKVRLSSSFVSSQVKMTKAFNYEMKENEIIKKKTENSLWQLIA